MSHVILRTARSADVPELVQISLDAVAASGYTDEQISVWSLGLTEEKLLNAVTHNVVLVADEQGVCKGFATLTERGENAGEIDLLYVDPKYARRGVGRILVRGIEDTARQQEMSALWVDASAPAAHRLQSLGFRIHDSYKKVVNDVVFHNTWMLKRLNS